MPQEVADIKKVRTALAWMLIVCGNADLVVVVHRDLPSEGRLLYVTNLGITDSILGDGGGKKKKNVF